MRFARAAGAVHLLVLVVAAIVQVSVHAGIDVPGTANVSAQDSGAGSTLPAVTRDADVSMAVSFLLVGVTLYAGKTRSHGGTAKRPNVDDVARHL